MLPHVDDRRVEQVAEHDVATTPVKGSGTRSGLVLGMPLSGRLVESHAVGSIRP